MKFVYQNITAIAISGKGFELKLKEYVKDDLEFHYLPNWADDLNMDIEAVEFSKDDRVQFTFAGNIGKVQNLENIIKAFCLISDKSNKKAQLNVIGDGSNLKYLKELTDKNKHVIFHGKKIREDMSKYYKGSDFLIVSLVDEPIFSVTVPAKTQTYIAAKKPILAIINGDTADIVRDNNLGLCANPANIDLIVDAFEQCIDMSQTERECLTTENDRLLNTIFNKEKTIDKLLEVLIKKD